MSKFVLASLFLIMTLPSCSNLLSDTSTTLIKSASNTNKNKKAVLLHNDGNAAVDFSLQVSILDNGYTLTGKELGNAFIVDGNHGATSLDSNSINFKWLSDDTLQIEYDKKLSVFLQEKSIEGVTINYMAR